MEQNHASVLLAACEKRREERRSFLRAAGSVAAIGAGASLLAACKEETTPGQVMPTPSPTPTPTPTPTTSAPSEADVLNFALNLEYLEAQFYSFAAFGVGLDANLLTGTGTQGTVVGGQRVTFTDPLVAAYAREIARDEIAHVAFLRTAIGSTARVSMPTIDISANASGAFSAAARAAGLISGTSASFNPYASDENFLLAAFLFEDVGTTAYKGGIRFLTTAAVVEAAAGIHAAESYHAGLVRTVLYRKGLSTASLITSADAISDARDRLDGSTDLDQGISSRTSNGVTASNIVPTDANGITFTRTPGQVLNVVYLNSAAVTGGGFFPNGVNGTLRTSAASG
ncbi:ferritin-like domain-containing protein [uncultured Sphingomonas sp.]|uniref:ferritin-like domain-containing protein n=1 Tax=uncultured Sphingomonas sp. TaxID=158754 RepID=UPI0025E5CB3B|nr:ferritin-like domain-containing protein [uncultured Sphingomonas sp.]